MNAATGRKERKHSASSMDKNEYCSTTEDGGKESSPSGQNLSNAAPEIEVDNSEEIWSKKLDIDIEPVSREEEFERYLEDLLL